ncbi:hypothetical protein, variant [Cladophialophora immunda]|uniref:Uncharacterized protein n=1 Tax=Cladophialophora immunda TaxID=569365 RepID=A0A0D1ZTY6_9EURO|nr:uncharacterized protein PV07_03165 [Cladophialophora immunda]XP_016251737.1 hypothetical protein, variant [Cladophialophora immunda]KIW31520.1 hypothetical protein PV07_03165 [Cladophialophora immunda]KIW31521.1 hypothetical protein, variant [Cladophialophora immunda]
MIAWEKITRLIVGRAVAERSEHKKLEKKYKEAEAALKLVTEVAPEPLPQCLSRPSSLWSAAISEDSRKPREGVLRTAQRPNYERSSSTPAVTHVTPRRSPSGPPDITARSLSQEELKRNYSSENFWDTKIHPLPPMPEMTGFGKYRRAVNASPEWQLEHLHKHLYDMSDIIVGHLGSQPPVGLDPETWNQYRTQYARTTSFASSRSSTTGLESAIASEYLDPVTGTKITRGFSASTTSSAASSFKEGSITFRRDSSFSKSSMTSPLSDVDVKGSRRPSRTSSYHASITSMHHLTAISEIQEPFTNLPRKIEKPCVFDANGNTESALASDEDEELEWEDMLEVGGANISNLTKRLDRTSSSRAMSHIKPALNRPRTKRQRSNTVRRVHLVDNRH